MACIQYPRKERGGVSLPSWEQPTIYKEPPKEIFTRKKERVEEGDITYNIRNDASRYNDAVMTYAKGQNAMVEVDYQNRGFGQTTTMNFGSASNPYKVNQSFRPPEFRLEDLQPLSRQRREWVGARTNPGSDLTRDDFFRENQVDQHEVAFATGASHTYHAEQSNLSKEQGIYRDNPEMRHSLNERYSTQNVLSQLKGLESVELEKMFRYQQTPNGIVLTPLSFEAISALSGLKDYEAQRNVADEKSYLSDPLRYSQQTSVVGVKDYEAHRTATDAMRHLSDPLRYSQQTSVVGAKDYESQRNVADEKSYLSDPLRYSQQTSVTGMKDYESQRNVVDEKSYLSDPLRYSQQTSVTGMKDYESQRNVVDEKSYLSDPLRYSQQTSVKGLMSKQEYLDVQKEKMKDVLLKNMRSNVAIVIQTSGGHDGQNINASVEDKINLVIQSALGQPISLQRDDGQPVKVKDYTWKFVKSASGADTFIIQADMPEMSLDRKSELYAAQANISQNIHVPIMSTVDLKGERINTSAQTNLKVSENRQNAERVGPELMVRKAEKETSYTDWMVQTIRPTLDRVDLSNLKSDKKLHLNKVFISEMDGRFNV
jgi:hypothetical protein